MSFKGRPALCAVYLLSWTAVFVAKLVQMVHKDVRKAALIFKDSWQTFPKLLGDIASGMAEEGYEKRCPHNCGQHVSSTGCFKLGC